MWFMARYYGDELDCIFVFASLTIFVEVGYTLVRCLIVPFYKVHTYICIFNGRSLDKFT